VANAMGRRKLRLYVRAILNGGSGAPVKESRRQGTGPSHVTKDTRHRQSLQIGGSCSDLDFSELEGRGPTGKVGDPFDVAP